MKIFTNVAALAAATLTANQLIETKGYYTAGDGGQARYLIKTAADYGATPDGYGDHTLANGNVAVLQDGRFLKQFGAGSSTPSAAVSAALNSSLPMSGNGCTFILDTTVSITNNNVRLSNANFEMSPSFVGDNKEYTYYDSGVFTNKPLIFASDVTDLIFDGVKVDGIGGALLDGSFGYSLVLLDNVTDSKLINSEFSNNQGDNTTSSGGAVFLVDCQNIEYDKCYMHDIKGEGIHSRSDNIKVTNSVFDTSTSSLVGSQRRNSIDSPTYNLTVTGCTFNNSTNTALSANSINSILSNNTITDSGYGINLGHRTTWERRAPAFNSLAQNNIIKNCDLQGINLAYANDSIVSNNYIYGCGLGTTDSNNAGIRSTYWTDKATISHNIIENCLLGIRVSGYNTDANETLYGNFIITNNSIFDIQRYGMFLQSSELLQVTGNTIRNIDIQVGSRGAIEIDGVNTPKGGTWLVEGNIIGTQDSPEAVGIKHYGWSTPIDFFLHSNLINATTSISGGLNRVHQLGNQLVSLSSRFTAGAVSSNTIDIGYAQYILCSYSSATTIDTISSNLPQGSIITLTCSNNNTTFSDGVGNLYLASTFAATTNDSLTLLWSGGAWYEIARSIN